MKSFLIKNLIVIFAFTVFVFCISCSSDESKKEFPTAVGYRFVDISKSGMNLYVAAPDSTVGVVDKLFDSSSKVYLNVGRAFKIIIEESSLTITQKKEEISNSTSDIEVLKKYYVSTDSTLLWETTIGDLSKFHFYYLFKSGDRQFSFSSPADEIFSQDQAAAMLKASSMSIQKENYN